MLVLSPEDAFPYRTCASIGTFDGVHRAHKYVLGLSLRCDGKGMAITFKEHPTREEDILTTWEEKLEILRELGIDVVLALERKHKEMGAEGFMRLLIRNFGVRKLILGYNNRFGRDREGSPEWLAARLKDFPLEITVVPPFYEGEEPISATRIRKLLKSGKVEEANSLLGHRYFLKGKVVKGRGEGGKLGFPTANLKFPPEKLLPADGVYGVYVREVRRFGLAHVGPRPTYGLGRSFEVHLLNFNSEIRGEITVEILRRIRGVKAFKSPQDLKEQISQDVKTFEKFLRLHRSPPGL